MVTVPTMTTMAKMMTAMVMTMMMAFRAKHTARP
jgi:hypothetical protein